MGGREADWGILVAFLTPAYRGVKGGVWLASIGGPGYGWKPTPFPISVTSIQLTHSIQAWRNVPIRRGQPDSALFSDPFEALGPDHSVAKAWPGRRRLRLGVRPFRRNDLRCRSWQPGFRRKCPASEGYLSGIPWRGVLRGEAYRWKIFGVEGVTTVRKR